MLRLASIAVAGLLSTVHAAASEPATITHVVLIGGFDSDPTPEQLDGSARRGVGNSGLYQLRNDLLQRQLDAAYFNWNGTPAGHINDPDPPGAAAVVRHVRQHLERHPSAEIALVGNSMGGHTAWDVCAELQRSAPAQTFPLVVFLDPSSVLREDARRPIALPKNVRRAVLYASRTAVIWRPWADEPRLDFIDLGDPRHGYLRPGGPAYDALFSVNAHIGAEWDNRIHADIVRRLSTDAAGTK